MMIFCLMLIYFCGLQLILKNYMFPTIYAASEELIVDFLMMLCSFGMIKKFFKLSIVNDY